MLGRAARLAAALSGSPEHPLGDLYGVREIGGLDQAIAADLGVWTIGDDLCQREVLLGAVVKLRIELNVRCRSQAVTGLQEQRFTRKMIKIEAVDQIIGVLVPFGQGIKVKTFLDEFQH